MEPVVERASVELDGCRPRPGARWVQLVQRWLPDRIDYVWPWTQPADDIGVSAGRHRLSAECKDQGKLDLAVPTGPGLGVEVDRPRLQEVTVRRDWVAAG